uniref:Uncharacterized protein n=1 Tax=Bubo bubo TaxID=30461 RepID=A0A8C0FD85_BUBBB
MLQRSIRNSWAQAIRQAQPLKSLGLQAHATTPGINMVTMTIYCYFSQTWQDSTSVRSAYSSVLKTLGNLAPTPSRLFSFAPQLQVDLFRICVSCLG